MLVGLISEELSLLKEAKLAIVCNGLKVTGGGTSPSIGLVHALCGNPQSERRIYSLVRPSVSLLDGSRGIREITEAEVEAQSQIAGLTGFMVGPFAADHKSIDQNWCINLVKEANGKEVWLHNGILLFSKEDLSDQLRILRQCGVHGVLAPLHGDTLPRKIDFAKSVAKAAAASSLKVIVTGDINFNHEMAQVKQEFASMEDCVIGIATPVVVSDDMHGQLLDWRLWDVCSNLFDVRNQWRPTLTVALNEINHSQSSG